MDPLTRLRLAVEQARPIVAAARPDDYHLPTPCPEWNVERLINHMIGALTMFRDVGVDGQADPALFTRDLIAGDAAASFTAAGAAAVRAWSGKGRLDGAANLPFGSFPASFALQLPAMDMVVHGWDLATATGQHVAWNPELVADTLAFSLVTFADPQFRGDDFAPPVEVPDDSDGITRLVAFLGRQP
jgi:uncharacterized protein (TIGR03086 family)